MEFNFDKKKKTIKFDRVLSQLDKLVIKFTKILHKEKIDYVIISGYIAILFGRSRQTEDVDLFVEELGHEKLKKLWTVLDKEGFYCLNAFSPEDALINYLNEKLAIRFALKDTIQPNFELKYPKSKYNYYSLNNKLSVILNQHKINTSELELQIAFKLSLGSPKDLEDARYLYKLFRQYLNIGLLQKHITELKVTKVAEEILWRAPRV